MTAKVPFEGHPKAYVCELYRTYMERREIISQLSAWTEVAS